MDYIMTIEPKNDIRLDYLDAVRSFALILGIIFHASLSFIPIFIGWAVMDLSTSDFVTYFILVNHSFRMELFFLVAGFFGHLAFHKQGAVTFLKSRFVRIAIPLMVGWFILKPMLTSGWIMGAQSMRGTVNIGDSLVESINSLSTLPSGLFVGTHLWFLYYLLTIYISVLCLRLLIGLIPAVKHLLNRLADSLINWFCHSKLANMTLAIPTAACLWFMKHWGVDTPDKSLIPDAAVSFLYTGFFVFGWLLHRQPLLMASFAKLSWFKTIAGIIAVGACITLSGFEGQTGHAYYDLIKAAYLFGYALMMWSLVSVTIGVCKVLFNRASAVVRYIADASYWLYLVHLPIVVWLQIVFAELPLHWLLKLLSISAITIAGSIIMYDAFVRPTFIGAVLNGTRKPRFIFKASKTLEDNKHVQPAQPNDMKQL